MTSNNHVVELSMADSFIQLTQDELDILDALEAAGIPSEYTDNEGADAEPHDLYWYITEDAELASLQDDYAYTEDEGADALEAAFDAAQEAQWVPATLVPRDFVPFL